jgi:DedD protein
MGLFFKRKEADEPTETVAARRARKRALEGDSALDPLDPLELAKQKARRRLIGAIALVLGAVVLLPMVFDSEPKHTGDDLSVSIPSQNSSFNPPLAPSSGASSSVTPPAAVPPVVAPAAQSSLVPGAPVTQAEQTRPVPSSSTPATGASATTAPVASATPAAAQPKPVPAKPVEVPAVKVTPAPAAPVTAAHDDPRALAALEGKSPAPTSKEEHETGNFAVQIGAFSNADKVKDVRDRLQAAGLKPYTESLSTAQGPRTRVRVGPFSTHEAAEAAREKVKGLGFDGSVVTL